MKEVTLQYNAHTTADYTHFQATALPHRLPDILNLYRIIITGDCSSLSSESFVSERAVVINELRQRADTSQSPPWEHLLTAVFGEGHAYAHGVGGSEYTVQNIQRADACAFYSTHYTPDNAQIIVAGNADLAVVRPALFAAFATIQGKSGKAVRNMPPLEPGEAPSPGGPETCSGVSLIFPFPHRFHWNYFAAQIWVGALQRVFDDMGDSNDAPTGSVAVLDLEEAPLLIVSATSPKSLNKTRLTNILWHAIRLAKTPANELVVYDGQRQALKSELLATWSNLQSRAQLLAEYADSPRGYGLIAGDLLRLNWSDAESVDKVAERYFVPANARILDVVPECVSPSDRRHGALRSNFAPSVDTNWLPGNADESGIYTALERWFSAMDLVTLKNGLQVLLLPHLSTPNFYARLLIRNGRAQNPSDMPLLADLTANLIHVTTDVPSRFAREADEFEIAGGTLLAKVSQQLTAFSVSGLPTEADHLLRGLSISLASIDYDPKVLRDWREATGESALNFDPASPNLEEPFSFALRRSGGAPSCLVNPGGADQGRKAYSVSAMKRFRQQMYRAKSSVLLIGGQFEQNVLSAHIDALFGQGSVLSRTTDWDEPSDRDETGRSVNGILKIAGPTKRIVVPSQQLHVDTVFELPRVFRTDQPYRLILEAIVAAELRDLRQKSPTTYGFEVKVTELCGVPVLHIRGAVNPLRGSDAIYELDAALARLRLSPNTEFPSRFSAAKLTAALSLLSASSEGAGASALVEDFLRHGGSMTSFRYVGLALRGVSVHAFQEAIIDGLAKERMLRVCRGPGYSLAGCN